jgi:uncharacterized membrane protein YadS
MSGKNRWIEVNEDLMSLAIGVFICGIALIGVMTHKDYLGWVLTTNVWSEVAKAFAPASKGYAHMPIIASMAFTFGLLLILFSAAAKVMRHDIPKFVARFFLVFAVTTACWFIGNHSAIASRFTNEIWLVLCLVAGILIVNLKKFQPIGVIARYIVDQKQADLYVKTALVIVGLTLGVQAAGAIGTLKNIMLRGLIVVVANYLVTWTLAFLVAWKLFRFEADEAAVLASAISICGVAAAMAIGAAIKIRNKEFPSAVACLVVVYSAFELLVLPAVIGTLFYLQPYVAGSFMAMAVKTDGAAFAAGKITEAIVQQRLAVTQHLAYQTDAIFFVTAAEKQMIDVFIGVFCIILAAIFLHRKDEKREMGPVQTMCLTFPKFIIGSVAAFAVALSLAMHSSGAMNALKAVVPGVAALRVLLFGMTFLSLGLLADVVMLKKAKVGKLLVAYPAILLLVVIPVALGVSWLCFHGAPLPLKQ